MDVDPAVIRRDLMNLAFRTLGFILPLFILRLCSGQRIDVVVQLCVECEFMREVVR